jgi:hypothetical protein
MAKTITKVVGVAVLTAAAFTGGIAVDDKKAKVADTAYSQVTTDERVPEAKTITTRDTVVSGKAEKKYDTLTTPEHINREIKPVKITGVKTGDSVQVIIAVNGKIYFEQVAVMKEAIPDTQKYEFQSKFRFIPYNAKKDTLPMRVKIEEKETVEFDKDKKVKVK